VMHHECEKHSINRKEYLALSLRIVNKQLCGGTKVRGEVDHGAVGSAVSTAGGTIRLFISSTSDTIIVPMRDLVFVI